MTDTDAPRDGREIARHAVTVLFGRGVIRLSQFVAFLILARLLSVSEFGWFGIVTTAMTLAATLGSLGLRQSLAYEVGQNRLTPGEALGTGLILWPWLTLMSAAVVYAVYGDDLPGITHLQAAALLVVGVAGTMLLMLLQGIYLGYGSINAFSLSESMPRVALMIAAVALSLTVGVNLESALWAHVGSYVVALPIVIWLAVRLARRPSVRVDRLGTMLRYGLLFALNLLLITLCSRLSMFVIQHSWGPAAAGQFYAAVRVNEMFLEVATALGMVLFSNATRHSDGASVVHRNVRIASWLFWAFVCLAVLVALAAPVVITALVGTQYAAAGPALQILALGLGPAAACKLIYPTLAGSGRPAFGTPAIVACVLTNVVLALALVPSMGVNGGAVALVVGQYVLLTGYVISCRVRFKVPVRDFLIPNSADVRLLTQAIASRVKSPR